MPPTSTDGTTNSSSGQTSGVPDGTRNDVLAWVDQQPDKAAAARAALDAENTGQQRAVLSKDLQKIIDDADTAGSAGSTEATPSAARAGTTSNAGSGDQVGDGNRMQGTDGFEDRGMPAPQGTGTVQPMSRPATSNDT